MTSNDDASADRTVLHHIDELVAEEKKLRSHPGGLSEDERARLPTLEVQLDQAWDLLRQRRAREEAGESTSTAQERPASEVEGYLQ